MDLKSMATEVLMKKFGGSADSNAAQSALDGLLGGGEGFDLSQLVSQFTGEGGDLAEKAQSWLGDGANASVSAEQVQQAIGSDKVAEFASKLGIDSDEAGNGLSQLLPELIDKSSSGGSLLDSIGGAAGLGGLASRFLK